MNFFKYIRWLLSPNPLLSAEEQLRQFDEENKFPGFTVMTLEDLIKDRARTKSIVSALLKKKVPCNG